LTQNEGIEKDGLEPCYEIHKDTLDYKGYAHIQIPKGEDVLYPFIDYLYESWKIENIGIREQEQRVYISMRAGEISIQQSIPFIKKRTIEIAEGLFIVRSAYRRTNLELPIKLLDEVKRLAEGKSTLCRIVEGYEKPLFGRVLSMENQLKIIGFIQFN